MSEQDPIINAQAVLKTSSGKSLLDEQAITTKNIQHLTPSGTTVKAAITGLKQLGFDAQASGPTLSLSGKKSLFEKVFQFHLEVLKTGSDGPHYKSDKKATIPPPLKSSVAAIVFPEPMEYFG